MTSEKSPLNTLVVTYIQKSKIGHVETPLVQDINGQFPHANVPFYEKIARYWDICGNNNLLTKLCIDVNKIPKSWFQIYFNLCR